MSCERETETPPALSGPPSSMDTGGHHAPSPPSNHPPSTHQPSTHPPPSPAFDLHSIQKDLTYLSHHVYRMVLALQVPPCTCNTCSEKHVAQSNLILSLASANTGTPAPAPTSQAHNGHVSSQESESGSACQTPDGNGHGPLSIVEKDYDTDMSSEDTPGTPAAPDLALGPELGLTPQMPVLSQAAALFGASPQGLLDLSPEKLSALISATQAGTFGRGAGMGPLGVAKRGRGSGNVGRKSKYCTAEEKAAVAAYALVHGASAAARKFNIPPAVAAYYHRKIYNRALPKGRRPMFGAEDRDSTPTMVPMEGDSRGDFGSEGSASPRMVNASGNNGMGARVGTGKRGRPKLIGDDVDADLLTYLVNLRRTNPDTRINADSILRISTQFIRQRSPGLLVEDGGSVQLRPTWAMKMLMRMNEWERLMPANGEPQQMPPQLRLASEDMLDMLRSPGRTATVIPTSPGTSPPFPVRFPLHQRVREGEWWAGGEGEWLEEESGAGLTSAYQSEAAFSTAPSQISVPPPTGIAT